MIIRSATPDDARGIAEVHVRSWQAAYQGLLPADFLSGLSIDRREAMWKKLVAAGRPSLLVAELERRVVGFCAFGPCRDEGAGPDEHELEAIYVEPAHWFTGVGRALWESSRAMLRAAGASSLCLWVLAGNERAIGFYRAVGFRCEQDMSRVSSLGGVEVREVRCVLRGGGLSD
jgi:ribosomal protein S18 acetylase RimI-like enzyme